MDLTQQTLASRHLCLAGTRIHLYALVLLATVITVLVATLSDTAAAQERPATASIAPGELLLHFSYERNPSRELAGREMDAEYARVVALALDGLRIPSDQVQIEPLFSDVVERMRSQNLTEPLALLSLAQEYKASSERFLTSRFFSNIQRPVYNFARVVLIRFPQPPNMTIPQIIDRISSQRGRHRSNNLNLTPLPVMLSPVVGNLVDSTTGSAPEQIAFCPNNSPIVAILGDQFINRNDLPKLERIPVTSNAANGCDGSPYTTGNESYGTNLAGVISRFCPSCAILGFDTGCARQSKTTLRAPDVMRGIISAILRDASVIVTTTADRENDPLFGSIIRAAQDADVAVIAPAGDRGSRDRHFPASFPGVVGVGAIDANGQRAAFSNTGPWVMTAATGTAMLTAHGADGFATLSSSSLAAARIAALLARYLARTPRIPSNSMQTLLASGEFLNPTPQSCPGSSDNSATATPTSTPSASPTATPTQTFTPMPTNTPAHTATSTPRPAGSTPGGAPAGGSSGGGSAPPSGGSSTGGPAGGSGGGSTGNPASGTPPGSSGGSSNSGTPNQDDLCPDNPTKLLPGICGCQVADLDSNNNSVIDCLESSQSKAKSNNDSPFDRDAIQTVDNEANKVIAAELKAPEKKMTDLLSTLGVPTAKIPTLDTEKAAIQKGTKLDVAIDYSKALQCAQLKSQDSPFTAIFSRKSFADTARAYSGTTLPFGVEQVTLAADTTVGALRTAIKNLPCSGAVVGVQDASDGTSKVYANGTFNDPAVGRQQSYIEATKFEKAYDYFKKNATSQVAVAFIDTGFDLAAASKDVTQFHELMVGSNLVSLLELDRSNPDRPQDTDGHGTMVASVAAAAENNNLQIAGLAAGSIKLLPIRILKDNSRPVGASRLIEGIRLAVNAGARIINISLNETNQFYANPLVGEAIFRAIEKGVFFVFAGGDGIEDDNKVKFPIEIKSPTDLGIQRFGKTMTPASFGRYFKGALTVGGLETGGRELYLKSNYGPSVEIAAPATNIASVGLNGTIQVGTGTSFAASMVTAAAALVHSELTTRGFAHSPWLMEDIILNAMSRLDSLSNTVREGKVLDFEALKNYLLTLSQMSAEERARIPSDNPDVGTGWDPDRDLERIAEVFIDAPNSTSLIGKGESIQLRAMVRYTDGTLLDVTNHPKIFWTVEHMPEGQTSINPKTGLVSIERSATLAEGTRIRVLAHYNTDYLGKYELQLRDSNTQTSPSSLRISLEVDQTQPQVGQDFKVLWGSTVQLKVLGEFGGSGGKSITTDVTRVAQISSSKPEELVVNASEPGLLRTTQTFGGSSYEVTATYRGKTAVQKISVLQTPATLEIRNALGDPYQGQPVTLRAVLKNQGAAQEIPLQAAWRSLRSDLPLLQSGTSEVTIMTEVLTPGSYTVEASAPYRGMGQNASLTAQREFKVLDSIARTELLTKTPIISYTSRAVFALRLHNNNNSFTVVSPHLIRWSTSSPDLPIDSQGIVIPSERSLPAGKESTTYTVYADYLGRRTSAQVTILRASAINGLQSQLSHIVLNATWNQRTRCATRALTPGCEKIVVSGADRDVAGVQVLAYYTDGQTRDVTRYATLNLSHPHLASILMNTYPFELYVRPESLPGDVIRLTAVYEGQVSSIAITVLPSRDVELESPVPGTVFEVDTAQSTGLPSPRIRFTDSRGQRALAANSIDRPVLWSSADPALIAASTKLNTPLPHSSLFDVIRIDTSKLPLNKDFPITLTYTYKGFGLEKTLKADYVIRNTEAKPNGLLLQILSVGAVSELKENPRSIDCFLQYPTRTNVPVSCFDVDFKFFVEEGTAGRREVSPEVFLSRPQQTLGSSVFRNILPPRLSRNFLAIFPDTLDRRIIVEGTHKTLGFRSPPVTALIVGTDRIEPDMPIKPLPVEAPQKPDDPFCTAERRSQQPVAGGTGTNQDPFVICTPQQLLAVSSALDSRDPAAFVYIALKANLDFTEVQRLTPISFVPRAAHKNATPVILGNGYRLSNATIVDRERQNVGIFDAGNRGLEIHDLIIQGARIRGDGNVGIIAGSDVLMRGGVNVRNLQILGSSVQGSTMVGAILGSVTGMLEFDSVLVKDTQILFERQRAGCLIGYVRSPFKISNSLCTSSSINPAGVQGLQSEVGGLIGEAALGSGLSVDQTLDLRLSRNLIPIAPSEAWVRQASPHIFNSHYAGVMNVGLNAQTSQGQSNVGGLVGSAQGLVVSRSSAKVAITSIGSNIGGLFGTFKCGNRNGPTGMLYSSSFEGSITGGQSINGASNAGGLIGSLDGQCMIIKNSVNGTVRGRQGVGGLVGMAQSGHRFLENQVVATVSSTTERHGGFIGLQSRFPTGLFRVKDDVEYMFEDIYSGNTWQFTGSGRPPQDIGGTSSMPNGFDVNGVDRR